MMDVNQDQRIISAGTCSDAPVTGSCVTSDEVEQTC